MIWFFYNLLFPLVFLLVLPRFLFRMRKRGGYRDRFSQRFGLYEPAIRARLDGEPRVWIHAVSVGEMLVALQFIQAYRARHPGARFVLSTVTSTGRAMALKQADPLDVVLYFPLDFPPIVRRALAAIRPRMLILTEGELWPNLLRQCRDRGIPAVVINGRMSVKSSRGYRLLGPFTRAALGCVNKIYAQSDGDRQRCLMLGTAPDRVEVLGAVKYDAEAEPGAAARVESVLKQTWGEAERLILLGGSTWPQEETALGECYKRLRAAHPALRLVLVPRHFERAKAVAEELDRLGLTFIRRSELGKTALASPPDVLLVDTTGELKSFYAAADVVFVGKSLYDNRGGQNFIEPALFGKPVLTGPHVENFPGIEEDFRKADAFLQVADAEELTAQVNRLLRDPAAREGYGRRALELIARRRGVMSVTVDRIGALLGDQP